MIINNCHSITKHCLKLVLVHVWYSRVCIIQVPKRHSFLCNSCKQKGIKHLSCSVTRKSSLSMAWQFKYFSTDSDFEILWYLSKLMILGSMSKDIFSTMDTKFRKCYIECRDKVSNGHKTEFMLMWNNPFTG